MLIGLKSSALLNGMLALLFSSGLSAEGKGIVDLLLNAVIHPAVPI